MSSALRIEQDIAALFFDSDALKAPAYQLRRINTPKGRYYYAYDESMADPQIFIGMTSLLAVVIPKPEGLIKWMCSVGYDSSKEYMRVRASYGTFLHIQIAQYHLDGKKYDLDAVEKTLIDYIKKEPREVVESRHFDLSEWVRDIKMDLLSWFAFVKDYNVRPLAIEIPLAHPDGYSGTLDIPCRMDIPEKGMWGEVYKSGEKKGQPKQSTRYREVVAIADIKSTRKGTAHDDYRFQLAGYKKLWDYSFPDTPIEKMYNWSPNEWRKSPTYTLSDKTDDVDDEVFDGAVKLGKRILMKKDPEYQTIEGFVDEMTDLQSCIKQVSLMEHIKLRQTEPQAVEDVQHESPVEYLMNMVRQLQSQVEMLQEKIL